MKMGYGIWSVCRDCHVAFRQKHSWPKYGRCPDCRAGKVGHRGLGRKTVEGSKVFAGDLPMPPDVFGEQGTRVPGGPGIPYQTGPTKLYCFQCAKEISDAATVKNGRPPHDT